MSTTLGIRYNIASDQGKPVSATVFPSGGTPLVATHDHPNWERIVKALTDGAASEADVVAMFDVGKAVARNFFHVSDRVMLSEHGTVLFDGDPMDDGLTRTILRFYAEGNDDFLPLVSFLEKVQTNPNKHSREQLFRWLTKNNFGLAPDGDIICYKAVKDDGKSDRSGEAFVNGVHVDGRIPNDVDAIIEMPRTKVHHNPHVACSTGLHVANWGYAWGFGPRRLRVKVNPRDVVSVPTDSSDQKMRVSRYRVLDVVTAEDKTVLHVPDESRTLKFVPRLNPELKVVEEKPRSKKAAKKQARKAAAKKAQPQTAPEPEYVFPTDDKGTIIYELFVKKDFDQCAFGELRWLAKEWGVAAGSRPSKPDLVKALVPAARGRRKSMGL